MITDKNKNNIQPELWLSMGDYLRDELKQNDILFVADLLDKLMEAETFQGEEYPLDEWVEFLHWCVVDSETRSTQVLFRFLNMYVLK